MGQNHTGEVMIGALTALSGVRRSNWLIQSPISARENLDKSMRNVMIRQATDLDLFGRDPTPDGVGMSIPIIPAARAAVLTLVSLQLIALVHQSGPVTGVRRRALAALSTSDVWRVGHQVSTGSCGPCLGPTAGARE